MSREREKPELPRTAKTFADNMREAADGSMEGIIFSGSVLHEHPPWFRQTDRFAALIANYPDRSALGEALEELALRARTARRAVNHALVQMILYPVIAAVFLYWNWWNFQDGNLIFTLGTWLLFLIIAGICWSQSSLRNYRREIPRRCDLQGLLLMYFDGGTGLAQFRRRIPWPFSLAFIMDTNRAGDDLILLAANLDWLGDPPRYPLRVHWVTTPLLFIGLIPVTWQLLLLPTVNNLPGPPGYHPVVLNPVPCLLVLFLLGAVHLADRHFRSREHIRIIAFAEFLQQLLETAEES